MSSKTDPFEAFRRARQEEGFRRPAGVDRQAVAHRISNIIDNVTGCDESVEDEAEPHVDAPSSREIHNIVERLSAAAEAAEDSELRDACVDLMTRFLARAHALLDGSGSPAGAVGDEYVIDHSDLFDFMRAPDLGRLRRAKGLPVSDRRPTTESSGSALRDQT